MTHTSLERRVVIVDDSRTIQALLDNAFSGRPDFRVVGFSSDANIAAEMIRRLMPDVVTIDLCMPYLNGAALLEMIGDLTGVCKVIVSDQPIKNILLASKLLQAGASVCLGKRELVDNPDAFFKKINAAANAVANGKRRYLNGVRGPAPLTAVPAQGISGRNATQNYPIPLDEAKRLDILNRKNLNNSARERQFDLITRHVARITAFPVCLLTFIDRDTQWIKSTIGLEADSMPRHQAFCNYTIAQGGAFVVANAAADDRFSGNPLVLGGPAIRCYAGHPVTTNDGVTVGALCVIDNRVRNVPKHVLDQLAGMSEIVAELIDQRPAIAA